MTGVQVPTKCSAKRVQRSRDAQAYVQELARRRSACEILAGHRRHGPKVRVPGLPAAPLRRQLYLVGNRATRPRLFCEAWRNITALVLESVPLAPCERPWRSRAALCVCAICT